MPSFPAPGSSPDRYAVALGNASLLGVGYLQLRRPGLAVLALGGTVGLVVATALFDRPLIVHIALLAWWLGGIAHGWQLAGSHPTDTAGRQRLLALCAVIPVLLVVALLRGDALRIERTALEAHRGGDCPRALSTLDGLWAGHRVVDAELVARAEDATGACALLVRASRQAKVDRAGAASTLRTYLEHPGAVWSGANARRANLLLAQAEAELDAGLGGVDARLDDGFDHLGLVLSDYPSRLAEVDAVLDRFLRDLPKADPCAAEHVTDWLVARPASGDRLDRAAEGVPRLAPPAIVGCGDERLSNGEPRQAKAEYERLLAEYPEHELAATAERGAHEAELAIQLANLRQLLAIPYGHENPAYCRHPAPYGGAEPYRAGGGPYPALLYGIDGTRKKLPSSWLASDATDAALVICAGDLGFGAAVDSCEYRDDQNGATSWVSFHNRRIPVRAYELRTGDLVKDGHVEIGGTSCPYFLTYFGSLPSKQYVDADAHDVREAYKGLIYP